MTTRLPRRGADVRAARSGSTTTTEGARLRPVLRARPRCSSRSTPDVVVVFGARGRDTSTVRPTTRSPSAATMAVDAVESVTAARSELADELELLEAVRAVDDGARRDDVDDAMLALGLIAADVALVRARPSSTSPRASGSRVVERGWTLRARADQVAAALARRAGRRALPVLRPGRRAIVPLPGAARRGCRDPLVLPARAARASPAACCSSRTPTRRRAASRCSAGGSALRLAEVALGSARRRAHAGVDARARRLGFTRSSRSSTSDERQSASGASSSAITSNHT